MAFQRTEFVERFMNFHLGQPDPEFAKCHDLEQLEACNIIDHQ